MQTKQCRNQQEQEFGQRWTGLCKNKNQHRTEENKDYSLSLYTQRVMRTKDEKHK